MRRLLFALFTLLSIASATTTVSGNLKDLGTTAISSGTYVRFYLRGCAGNQPRVSGTALFPPSGSGVWYKDFTPNSSGVISGTLYSTRDSTGLLAGQIECGGSLTAVWYGMVSFRNGIPGPEVPVHAKNGATLDVTNVTAITTNPVTTAPTGDSTYLRIDTGNAPLTGNLTFDATGRDVCSTGARCDVFGETVTSPDVNAIVVVDGTKYARTNAGIQAAIDAAPRGSTIFLPTGTYTLSAGSNQQILIDKSLKLQCAGMNALLTVSASVGGTVDVIKIKSASENPMEFVTIENCMFIPASGTPGRYGIEIDTTTRAIARLNIRNNYLGAFGSYGIHSSNPTPLTDGFYASWIKDNAISNGIQLNAAGDMITIAGNTLSGANIGIDVDLVDAGGGNNAAMTDIRENVVTNTGGCIKLRRAHNTRIKDNFCEGAVGLTYSNNAHIDIDGTAAIVNSTVEVAGNKITPISTTQDAIRVNYCEECYIHHNFIANANAGGGTRLYRITANAIAANIADNTESPLGQTAAQVMADLGTGTRYYRPQGEKVHASKTANQAITTATQTAVTFDAEALDTDTLHSTSANTSRLTVQVTGTYQITCSVDFAVSAAGTIRQIAISKNGANPPLNAHSNGVPVNGTETRLTTADMLQLVATDYVECFVYQDSGGNLNVNGNTRTAFSMFQIR